MSPREDPAEKMCCYAFSTLPHSEADPDFTGADGRIFVGSSLLSDETIYKIQRFKSNFVSEIYSQWKFYQWVQRDQNITIKISIYFC